MDLKNYTKWKEKWPNNMHDSIYVKFPDKSTETESTLVVAQSQKEEGEWLLMGTGAFLGERGW